MAHTIEILSLGDDQYPVIRKAAEILNEAQGQNREFVFTLPPDRLCKEGLPFKRKEYYSGDVYGFLEKYRQKARGHRPYLVAVVSEPLRSDKLANIFGDHNAKNGFAVFTLRDHSRYAPSPTSFVCYYLIRYALSFVAPEIKNHEDTRACFFDKKMFKPDLLKSLSKGDLCDRCMESLQEKFNPEIYEAILAMIRALKQLVTAPPIPVRLVSPPRASVKIPEPQVRDLVFISYSHKDDRWLKDLQTHLKPYLRAGSIVAWSDKQIAPGSKWFAEIQLALSRTRVAVLIVTPAFLASNFIDEHELGPLLAAAKQASVTILWVPARPCSYEQTGLKDLQAVISPEKPLALMKAERDKAWVTICKEIEKAMK